MDVQALIDRCEDEHAQPVAPKVIWPGQPGGYEPTVYKHFVRDAALVGNLAHTPQHQGVAASRPKPARKKPKQSGFTSMHGISAKADDAVKAYRQKGVEMEERRKKAREGKKPAKKRT